VVKEAMKMKSLSRKGKMRLAKILMICLCGLLLVGCASTPKITSSYSHMYNNTYIISFHAVTKKMIPTNTIFQTLLKKAAEFWGDIDFQNTQNEGGISLPTGKKPEFLLYRVIDMTTSKQDLVLDFFMGTGTTCAVSHKMGRRYIGVEQLDYGENSAVVRLKNVINGEQSGISKAVNWQDGGDFVYLELMKWNENFVQDIRKAKTKEELKKLWEKMKKKAFLSYKVDIEEVDKNAKDFADSSIENKKRFLLECLDKNHLYVNYSEIDDEEYGVSKEDKKLNRKFYADQKS
jgi:adenine-specific DNA-methyltransferase